MSSVRVTRKTFHWFEINVTSIFRWSLPIQSLYPHWTHICLRKNRTSKAFSVMLHNKEVDGATYVLSSFICLLTAIVFATNDSWNRPIWKPEYTEAQWNWLVHPAGFHNRIFDLLSSADVLEWFLLDNHTSIWCNKKISILRSFVSLPLRDELGDLQRSSFCIMLSDHFQQNPFLSITSSGTGRGYKSSMTGSKFCNCVAATIQSFVFIDLTLCFPEKSRICSMNMTVAQQQFKCWDLLRLMVIYEREQLR